VSKHFFLLKFALIFLVNDIGRRPQPAAARHGSPIGTAEFAGQPPEMPLSIPLPNIFITFFQ
jgi:hypothetical protein